MDNYNLFLIKNDGKKYNITKLIQNLSWNDDLETLGTKLNFVFARNRSDSDFSKFDILEIGDKSILNNGENEIFRGIITDVDWGRYQKTVTAFDYAFYLNQSKTVKQFYKIAASDAIKKLCKEFDVDIGEIISIKTKITTIYKDKTIAEIIKDVLAQAEKELGTKYRLEMREGKLYIQKYIDITIKPTYQPYENAKTFEVVKAIGDIGKSESIQELRNSILVYSDNEKPKKIREPSQDTESIKKYGLLQEILIVDKKNQSQASTIAKNKLKELNKISTDISITCLGNDLLRAGRIIEITDNSFNLKGKFLIKSSSHTYNNSIHKASLTLEGVI